MIPIIFFSAFRIRGLTATLPRDYSPRNRKCLRFDLGANEAFRDVSSIRKVVTIIYLSREMPARDPMRNITRMDRRDMTTAIRGHRT